MAKTAEEWRAYHREWSKNNWESRKASYYKWKAKNMERVREIDNKCYAETKSKDKPRRMLQGARWRATKSNLPFNIDITDVVIPEYCPVFNWIKLGQGDRESRPELDKIVPSLGYVKGNVRVISGRANRIKSDATLEELKLLVASVPGNS